MQSNRTCQLVEQYLSYLAVIKGRSENTTKEYRTDLLMFFEYVKNSRSIPIIKKDFSSRHKGKKNRLLTAVLEIP